MIPGSPSPLLVGGATANDPNFSSVVALLHFDGTNGSTTFTDQKGHTFSAVGDAKIDTAQSKFGGASMLLDGTGDCAEAATTADWNMGAGDFTIEAWVRPDSAIANATICDIWTGTGFSHIFLYLGGSPLRFSHAVSDAAGTGYISNLNGAFSSNLTWTHFAFVRNGSSWKWYINGTHDVTADFTSSITPFFPVGSKLRIGMRNLTTTNPFKGWIDDFRITKGVARYTTDFTPPTAPFPNQ